MGSSSSRAVRSFAAGAILLGALAGAPAPAADTIQGTFAAEAQKRTLAHGLAWRDAKGVLKVRFFSDAPTAKEEARALADDGTLDGVFAKPNVTLDLGLQDGAAALTPEAFESCHLAFSGFEGGRFDANGFRPQCGVLELSGDLRPGGVVHGRLQGHMEAFPAADGHRPAYTWDLEFTATLRARP